MKPLAALLVLFVAPALARADASLRDAGPAGHFACRPKKSLLLIHNPLVELFAGRPLSAIVRLSFDNQQHLLTASNLEGDELLWRAPVPGVWADSSVDGLLDGRQVFIVFYSFTSSGSTLMSFDLSTGRRLWTAHAAQLNVAHAQYWNEATLEKRGDAIVLRGDEAGGCYLQVFDPRTGRRRSSVRVTR